MPEQTDDTAQWRHLHIRNFRLLPSGAVLIQSYRALKGPDGLYPEMDAMFIIAASYWLDEVFVSNGQDGWMCPVTKEMLDQLQLKDRIENVINTSLMENLNFQGFYASLLQAATANAQFNNDPLPPALWPVDAHQIIDLESCVDFSTNLREETVNVAYSGSGSSSGSSVISLGSADTLSAGPVTLRVTNTTL